MYIKATYTYMKSLITILLAIISFNVFAISPNKNYIRLPQQRGLIYKELNVITKDGYNIKTWFFPAQEIPSQSSYQEEMHPYKTIDNKPRPTIIICNGDAGNMSYIQIFCAEVYASLGYNVVTFDWRGFGQSSDFPMDENYLCYTEMLEDYRAVIREVKKQKETDKDNIYLFGWSTGAYLSMITAHNNKSITGLFVIGMPTSFEEVIPHLIKVHPKKKMEDNLIVPEDFPKDEMPIYIAPRFKKPILLVVGSEDDRTPKWMSENIFAAISESTFKQLSVFDGAGHGGMESPMLYDTERFITETNAFLEECRK